MTVVCVTFSVNVLVSSPAEFTALMVNEYSPAFDGIPVISPLSTNESPSGIAPSFRSHETPAPSALSFTEYFCRLETVGSSVFVVMSGTSEPPIFSLKLCERLPAVFEASALNENSPSSSGTPEITPDDESSSPFGSIPPESFQYIGAEPEAMSSAWYSRPFFPPSSSAESIQGAHMLLPTFTLIRAVFPAYLAVNTEVPSMRACMTPSSSTYATA